MKEVYRFSDAPAVRVEAGLADEINAYWRERLIVYFSSKNLIDLLVLDHRDFLEGFVSEDDFAFLHEQAEAEIMQEGDKRNSLRRGDTEFVPWVTGLLDKAQKVAGEQPVGAVHLLYTMLEHTDNDAYSTLQKAIRPGKLGELKQSLYQKMASSQAA